MNPWSVVSHTSKTLPNISNVSTTITTTTIVTNANLGIFSGVVGGVYMGNLYMLKATEAANYLLKAVGGGGAGGAYAQNNLQYAPGGGGGGGGTLNLWLTLNPGDVLFFIIAVAVNVPGMDGEPTVVILIRATGIEERYEVQGGKGGQTWNGQSLVPPLGGLGGVALHQTLDGQAGQNSFFVKFSAPPPLQGVVPRGGTALVFPEGKGGNGGTNFEVTSDMYGMPGAATYQIVGT